MKRLFLFFVISCFFGASATATVHTVMVSDFVFAPSSVTASVGDTIRWVWSNGDHTTTSAGIPAGASAWNAPISSTATTFSYKLTVAGTYNYVCTPHASMSMVGTIVAQAPAGIKATASAVDFKMYPNPAAGNLRIELTDARQHAAISVTDALGRTIMAREYRAGENINISTAGWAKGVYTLRILAGGIAAAKTFEIGN